jgi:hypothetical protein
MDTTVVVLASEAEAREVLNMMQVVLDRYGFVNVSDFLELVGMPATHLDQNSGWANLINVKPKKVENGYILDLPVARPKESSISVPIKEGQVMTIRKTCNAPAPLVVNGFPFAGCSESEGHYPGTQHKFVMVWG